MVIIDLSAQHELVDIDNENSEIFRVLEVSKLFDLFESGLLWLTAPKLWDDPYENFLKHISGISNDKDSVRISFEGHSKYIFGQCWTLNEETDATWRIYSPNKDRVKIKTTIAKLYNNVKKINEDGFHSYLGKIRYIPEHEMITNIVNGIKKSFINFHPDNLIRKYYLTKREAFAYENEVRLMVRLPAPPENYRNAIYQYHEDLDLCYLPLDNPVEFIDEVVFDPRMPDSLVKAYTSYLCNNLKFNKDIYKSTLYTTPIIREPIKAEYW